MTETHKQFSRERASFPTTGAGTTRHAKGKLETHSKWVTDPNVKCKIVKLLERKIYMTWGLQMKF